MSPLIQPVSPTDASAVKQDVKLKEWRRSLGEEKFRSGLVCGTTIQQAPQSCTNTQHNDKLTHNDSTHSTEGADAGRGERVLCPETHTHTQGKHTVFSHREAVLLTHPHEHSQHTQAQIVTVQSGAVNVVDPVHCSGRSCFQSS